MNVSTNSSGLLSTRKFIVTTLQFPGCNNIDDGALLSLGSLTDIKIASNSATFDLVPVIDGLTSIRLSRYGLYCIGGHLKIIEVPVLEPIGGLHYLINKYSMAMDNVVSYDVMLGNSA